MTTEYVIEGKVADKIRRSEKRALFITWIFIALPILICAAALIVTSKKVSVLNDEYKETQEKLFNSVRLFKVTSDSLDYTRKSLTQLKTEFSHFDSVKNKLSATIANQKNTIDSQKQAMDATVQEFLKKIEIKQAYLVNLERQIERKKAEYETLQKKFKETNERTNLMSQAIDTMNILIRSKEQYIKDLKDAENSNQIKQVIKKYESKESPYYRQQQQQQQLNRTIKYVQQQQQQQQQQQ